MVLFRTGVNKPKSKEMNNLNNGLSKKCNRNGNSGLISDDEKTDHAFNNVHGKILLESDMSVRYGQTNLSQGHCFGTKRLLTDKYVPKVTVWASRGSASRCQTVFRGTYLSVRILH